MSLHKIYLGISISPKSMLVELCYALLHSKVSYKVSL